MALFQHSRAKNNLLYRLKPFLDLERFYCSLGTEARAHLCSKADAYSVSGEGGSLTWRKLNSRYLGISRSMIPSSSYIVLKILQGEGFQAYLVGGCVRDLILNKEPKDFDVITTAKLTQVKHTFQRAIIVGQRFPICRVFIKGSMIEVSSFETAARHNGKKHVSNSQMPKIYDSRDYVRWKNCMSRDFTVNSLFFDPLRNVIFDYTNALEDLRSLKLRTVIPAHTSFKEDEARILRGLRLAARLNLSFAKETEAAMFSLSSSVTGLCKSRIFLEMNYMLSYGAAEASLLLLKRFKLLEIFFPFQASYILEQEDKGRDFHSVMLMKLFSSLDQLVTCGQPCHDSLWVAIMAFHLALFSKPQQAIVVLAIASLLSHGTWKDSIKLARQNAPATHIYVPEILDGFDHLSDDEIAESISQFAGEVENSVYVLMNIDSLFKAMTRFPKFVQCGLVFVSQRMAQRVQDIFSILKNDTASFKTDKRSSEINYDLLKGGDANEIRSVLGKVILHTLISGPMEKHNINVTSSAKKLGIYCSQSRSASHDENRRRISPENPSGECSFGTRSPVDDDRTSRKLETTNFDLFNNSLAPNKTEKDGPKQVTRKTLLSDLFLASDKTEKDEL